VGPDRDHDDPSRRDGGSGVTSETQPVGPDVGSDRVIQTRLEERRPTLVERRDPGAVNLDPDDVVAPLGEACGGDEADVAKPHDRELHRSLPAPDPRVVSPHGQFAPFTPSATTTLLLLGAVR
jgi:hypothetical protein